MVAFVLDGVFGALSMSTTGGYHGMMGSGEWGWAIVFMALPSVILILVLIVALGGLSGRPAYTTYPTYGPAPTNAVQALDQRCARGELGRDEYLRMRADLTQR